MSHVADQIVSAVVADVTGLATTGTEAYDARTSALEIFPTLDVRPLDEEPGERRIGDTVQFRTLRVAVTGRVQVATAWRAQLDTIRLEVETALQASFFSAGALSSLVEWLQLGRVEYAFDDEHETPHGRVVMEWLAAYRVDVTAPDVVVT